MFVFFQIEIIEGSFCAMKISLSKAPLPGAPSGSDIYVPSCDDSLTDLQLFRKYCMPLGDTWPEAWSETPICVKHISVYVNIYLYMYYSTKPIY